VNGISPKKNFQTPISLDAAGRVVLPKALRESLHLVAGEPLVAEQREDEIVIRRKEQAPGLVQERGLLVYDSGVPPASVDIVGWIDDDRERRLRYVSGEAGEL
jgi:AbrB family looped-hinge helix DNA binding protein